MLFFFFFFFCLDMKQYLTKFILQNNITYNLKYKYIRSYLMIFYNLPFQELEVLQNPMYRQPNELIQIQNLQ